MVKVGLKKDLKQAESHVKGILNILGKACCYFSKKERKKIMLPRTEEFHLGANISKNRIANVSFEFDFQNATKPNCMLGIQYPNLQDFHATRTSWIQSRVEFKRV